MNPNVRNFALWVIIFLLVLALVTLFQSPGSRNGSQDLSYSQFLSDVDQGRIAGVTISGNDITGTLTLGTLRWGLGLAKQSHQHLRGEYVTIVMAASGRRVAELEYDTLMCLRDARRA